MILQVLKYSLLVRNVISIILFFIVQKNYSQDVNIATHDLIADIMYADTIVPDYKFKILESKLKRGLITKEDSISYISNVKNSKLRLFNRSSSKIALKILERNLNRKGKLTEHFSAAEIQEMISNVPEDENVFNHIFLPDRIKLISSVTKTLNYHKFSAPIKISDFRFLIYHFKNIGVRNKKAEFLIYEIDTNNNYTILDDILLFYH